MTIKPAPNGVEGTPIAGITPARGEQIGPRDPRRPPARRHPSAS